MNVPAVITSATDEYRGEMDIIGNFIRERCEREAGQRSGRRVFRDADGGINPHVRLLRKREFDEFEGGARFRAFSCIL